MAKGAFVLTACLAVAACGGPGDRADDAGGVESAVVSGAIEEAVADWYGSSPIGGAVAAVGLADDSIHVATTGEAAPGEPARPDDLMRIGSITKTFMAALTLRLADRGVLSLDDPVSEHLPALDITPTATVRDLLTHTSGIADIEQDRLVAELRADSGRRFEQADRLSFASIPDSGDAPFPFQYANAGYVVLGQVVERATGSDVAQLLREELFEPADLQATHLAGFEPVADEIVPGNVDLDGDGTPDPLAGVPYLAVESVAWAAGAMVSTPEDLITFARALFDGTLLDDQGVDELTTVRADEGQALGLFEVERTDGTAWGNSGGAPGFHANFFHDPDRRTTAVVFTNCPECAAELDSYPLLQDLLDLATD